MCESFLHGGRIVISVTTSPIVIYSIVGLGTIYHTYHTVGSPVYVC